MLIVRALAAALGALLAGCATPPPATPGGGWTSGRLSVHVEASAARAAQDLSAAFDLRGQGDRGELQLSSPLGTLLAVARWAPGSASLRTPQGERDFGSLDELARQALGEALPLAALPDWVAGRPWPGAGHSLRPEGFEQLDWTVRTERLGEGFITAQRSVAPAVVLRVRLDRSAP